MKSTERFSSRVDNYIRYRPHYPEAILPCLEAACGLSPASVIADMGSGTGILSELFLRNGNRVYGVEPNREMRQAGERSLQDYPDFISVNGTAEQTPLPDQSVDVVTAGQAFHWFDPALARAEFARILKPGGWVVLVWNVRRNDSPFSQDYETLLKTFGNDYERIHHSHANAAALDAFFHHSYASQTFENQQRVDFAGLKGRLLSSSYAPEAGHPQHKAMLNELNAIFERHQIQGQVTFDYETQMFWGQLAKSAIPV